MCQGKCFALIVLVLVSYTCLKQMVCKWHPDSQGQKQEWGRCVLCAIYSQVSYSRYHLAPLRVGKQFLLLDKVTQLISRAFAQSQGETCGGSPRSEKVLPGAASSLTTLTIETRGGESCLRAWPRHVSVTG